MKRKTDQEIEAIADKARAFFDLGPSDHVEFDVDLYVEKLGADLVPGNKLLDLIGIDSFWTKGFTELHIDKAIYLSTNNMRWRFTIAHELGHYFLHKEKENNLGIHDWFEFQINNHNERNTEEQEANLFASYFLISKSCLEKEIDNLLLKNEVPVLKQAGMSEKDISFYFSSELASIFAVSVQSMEIRIEKYWLKSYKK